MLNHIDFEYWKNLDFYSAINRNKNIFYFYEKEKGRKKLEVGISLINDLLNLSGKNFKILRNEYNKYKLRRKIKIDKITINNVLLIKIIIKNWNINKRHFITWKGQGERFIFNNYNKYPCFIFYDENEKPIGYNSFFKINNKTIVWAVSKSIDGENGLSSYMLIESLKQILINDKNLKYLNLTSYGSQKRYKLKFNPIAEKTYYTEEYIPNKIKGGLEKWLK